MRTIESVCEPVVAAYHLLDYPRALPRSPYVSHLATDESEVREAQRLRYRVFADEMGARLSGAEPGIDRDPFDPYCEHLLVRHVATDEVVGAYRILGFEQARRAGGFYSANEFDLRRLTELSPRLVEIGRACVHPAHRNGVVISLLWAGLLEYVCARRYQYVMGCASVAVGDDDGSAASICNGLIRQRLGPSEWRVFPYRPFPLDTTGPDRADSLPPLIKGYLRLGAVVCGEPAWDRNFRTADFLLLLPLADINPRYVSGLRRRAQRGQE